MLSRLKINALWQQPLPLGAYFHHYCTSPLSQSQSSIFADYLVNHLGFSRSSALSTSKKICNSKFTQNSPDSVVNFLKKLGLTTSQIKTIVSAHPFLLSYHVDKTLQPKIQALQEIGISGKDLTNFLIKDKCFFSRGLDTQIKPSIEYLRNVLGSDDNLGQAVKKYHQFFQFYKPDALPKKVEFLEKLGFPIGYVPKLLMKNPRCLFSTNEWLEKICRRVGKEFGISPGSKKFYYMFLAVASLDKSMKTKFELLRNFGLSDASIYEMVRRCPNALCASEGKLRKSWNFWVNELGYEPDYLVKCSVILCHSLDKRVKPRHEVLKVLNEKNLIKRNVCLYTVLCYTESRFIKSCLLPYKDVIPDVYSSYLKTAGLKLDGKRLV